MERQGIITFALACCIISGGAQANNLVVNSDFSGGLAGWTVTSNSGTATATYDASIGSPANGSAKLSTPVGDLPTAKVTISQCVAITAQGIDFRGRYRTDQSTGGAQASFGFQAFNAAGCSGTVLLDTAPVATVYPPNWTEKQFNNFPLPAGTQSVLISASFLKGDPVDFAPTAHIDHVLLGPTGTTPVELQLFTVD